MSEQKEDLPKILASVAWMVPTLALRTGWAYLKMKKKAQKTTKWVERSMVDNGIPSEIARQLADQFAEDMSVHNWMKSMDIPMFRNWGEKPPGK